MASENVYVTNPITIEAGASIIIVPPKGNKVFSEVTATNVAGLILAANPNRISALIVNNGFQTIYLGKNNSLTTANGIPLLSGSSLSDDDSIDAWYAIVSSGTADVRIMEVS